MQDVTFRVFVAVIIFIFAKFLAKRFQLPPVAGDFRVLAERKQVDQSGSGDRSVCAHTVPHAATLRKAGRLPRPHTLVVKTV